MSDQDEIKKVAQKFKLICNEEISDIEDQLPYALNPIEKDFMLKQIDALHEIADQANERAEEIVAEYYRNRQKQKRSDDETDKN
jgi:hypothetical protein